MGIFEIISAIVLIIACVFIIIVVLMQDTKTQMSKTISGNSSDNYYGKNSGRTKEAMLNKAMTTAAIVFFVLAIVVNVVNVYFGGAGKDTSGADTPVSSVSDTADSSQASDTESGADTSSVADTEADTSSDSESEAAPSQAESQSEADSTASAAEQ